MEEAHSIQVVDLGMPEFAHRVHAGCSRSGSWRQRKVSTFGGAHLPVPFGVTQAGQARPPSVWVASATDRCRTAQDRHWKDLPTRTGCCVTRTDI